MSDPWITTVEHQRLMAEKDAEIERLRRDPFAIDENETSWVLASEHERLMTAVRADECRRTAEEIAQAIGQHSCGSDCYRIAARIAREVGGSDD